MAFNWTDYHALAKTLASDPSRGGHREANLRAAISRAYYAAHHSARSLYCLEVPAVCKKTHGMHQETIDYFTGGSFTQIPTAQTRSRIATNLLALMEFRLNCDYDTIFNGNIELVVFQVIRMSENVIRDCEQITKTITT